MTWMDSEAICIKKYRRLLQNHVKTEGAFFRLKDHWPKKPIPRLHPLTKKKPFEITLQQVPC